MGLSGLIGAGANEGLEDILARQLLAQQQAERERAQRAQEEIASKRLSQDASQHSDMIGLRGRELDQRDASRRDESNRAGVEDMERQAKMMAAQQAEAQLLEELNAFMGDPSVPNRVKGLAKAGRLGIKGASADDFASPEKLDAEGRRKASQIGAEAEARARAEAKFRPASGGGEGFSLSEGQTRFDGSGKQLATVPKSASASGDPVSAARQVSEAASALLQHPGRSGAFGVLDARLPTFRQGTRDAEILRDRVKAMLTMENMNKMKGVLSDSDMKILQQASTSLDGSMSDQAAVAELTRVQQIMDRVASSGVAPVSSHEDVSTEIEYVRGPDGKLRRK